MPTKRLTDDQKQARRIQKLYEAATPYVTQPPAREVKRCMHCGLPAYSQAGVHPQCSFDSGWERRRKEEHRPAASPEAGQRSEDPGAGKAF